MGSFTKDALYNFLEIYVLCVCTGVNAVCVCCICAGSCGGQERPLGLESQPTWTAGSEGWELNLGSTKVQRVLLFTEGFLRPLGYIV